MQTFVRKIFVLTVALLTLFSVYAAEKVSFRLEVPMITSLGTPLRVAYELNAKPDADSFVGPEQFENFDIMAGPSTSSGMSVQMINGKTSKSVSHTITYILMPQKEGTFTIPSASISVDGKRYTTQRAVVEVRSQGGDESAHSGNNKSSGKEGSAERRANNGIEAGDLLLRLELSDKSVYKGEQIRAILKLYSRVNIAGVESPKMPTFNGFWSQPLEVAQGPFRETLNGKVYEAFNIAEYLLYPQQSGELAIQPAELTVVAQVMVPSNDPRDAFFGFGHEVRSLRRALKTPLVTVQVKEFPAGAPASFSGAVGRYTLSHKLSAAEMAANSAGTLQLTISGSGNLKFIQAPTLSLPASFEMYDVKSEEKIRNNASGSVGYRRFDYPFIVRAEGTYDIQPVEFTYFDVGKAQYVTLSTEPLRIVVTPDKHSPSQPQAVSNMVKREDVRVLGTDIRFIKTETPRLRQYVAPLVLSPLYFALIALVALVAAVAYFAIRKYMRETSNTVLVKGRRANKVAIKRLRIAERYMREQDRRGFYEEMLRALWGYLSDKLNIPVADLTKESVREELARRGAEAEGDRIIAIIQRCEEAQYSPVTSADMDEIYAEGIDVVSKTESAIKR